MEIIESKDYEQNFDDWINVQNKFGIKCVSNDLKYPKSLIIEAIKWFNEWAQDYKIDSSCYKYIRVSRQDGVIWQVDFLQEKDSETGIIYLCEIYFNTQARKIMQAVFSI